MADNPSQPGSAPLRWEDARVVHVSGNDPQAFLQGYVTSDAEAADAAGQPTTLCNLKGRVIASGWLRTADHQVSLLVHGSLAERVVEFLTPYARFARCQLAVGGAPMLQPSDTGLIAGRWAWVGDTGDNAGVDASAAAAAHLIETAFAWLSAPVSEKFLPQMLGLVAQDAVDFTKGCYLGQEVVARAQHRGAVKRQLQTFAWAHTPPAVGAAWPDVTGSTVVAVAGSPKAENEAQGSGLLVA